MALVLHCHRSGTMAAALVTPSPWVSSGFSAGCPCRMPTTAGGSSGRPMEGDGKAARVKATAAHVGCFAFWVVNRYVYQNAQTEICVPKCTIVYICIQECTIQFKKMRGQKQKKTTNMRTKTHRQRDAYQIAPSKICFPKRKV